MSHDKWDDDKIEDLLGKVPKIHDQRSKEEVINRIKKDGLLDDEPLSTAPKRTKKRKVNWIPIVVSIAALFLLAILVPSFINQDSSEESADLKATEIMDSQQMDISESTNEESETSILKADVTDIRTAVYAEELEGNTLFRLGLASDAADSLPISVLIPNERIQQDFGDATPTVVELYNFYAPLFNESAIEFTEYHPYAGTIAESGTQVMHTLPSDQPYDTGSAGMMTYFATLMDTFRDSSYEEAAVLDEEGSPFVFSEIGEPTEPIALNGEPTQFNYFRHTQADGTTYLAPNNRQTYTTVEEAISGMKEQTNDIYESVILPNVDFEVTAENQQVTVTFNEELNLESFDQAEAMQMIEGILLTAANFDMSVQFENVLQSEWGGFDFTAALPMPVGANEIPYSTVLE